MKKLFALLLLSISYISVYTQVTKGNWLVGGSGKFYNYKAKYVSAAYSTESGYTQFDLSPNVGYFLFDRVALGLRPTFSSLKGKVTTTGGLATNIKRYWIGPFGRYYFLSSEKQVNILADVSYQIGFLGGISKGNLSAFSTMVGPVVYFNSVAGIEFLLGYSRSKEDIQGYQKETRSGFQVAVGFQIHLERDNNIKF